MGRSMEGRLLRPLEVKTPSFFRCPISLELMSSPVSLCTGVTYDRSSIQQWLDSGHTTCPATMLPLPSTDLVPNLTLRRLILLWSASSAAVPEAAASDLIDDLRSSPNPLVRLSHLLSDPDVDESVKNEYIISSDCTRALASGLCSYSTREAAVHVFSLIFTTACIDERSRRIAASSLLLDLHASVASLVSVLRDCIAVDRKIDAARVLDALIVSSGPDSKILITEQHELLQELIRLIGDGDDQLVDAVLACLISASAAGRRVIVLAVRAGLVPALARVLSAELTGTAAERALRLMETAAECAEGRTAICERAEECVGAVVGRMMKVGEEGREAAVAVLWGVCHAARDPRARVAVAGASGGLAKILLLMQGNCSPEVRRMSGDLLRVFRIDPKSCLAGYDTKTTHIMPF